MVVWAKKEICVGVGQCSAELRLLPLQDPHKHAPKPKLV